MGGVAAVVAWDGPPADGARALRMLDTAPYRAPDGRGVVCRGRAALGMARFVLGGADWRGPLPPRAREGGPVLAADARVYNRAELRRLLGEDGPPRDETSDAALLLAAWERWGESLVERLDGDFAFVVWDPASETLLCARDPFGVKPLFYRREAGTFLVASEPEQVRAGSAETIGADEEALGRYYTGAYRDDGRTFLAGVRRVLPGTFLRVTREGVKEIRYWRPEEELLLPGRDAAAVRGELRARLRRAVEKRLDAEAPVVAELSGGYDSSAIVVLASGLLGPGAGRSRLSTISSTYAGLPCDESPYIREVLAATGMHGRTFEAPVDAADPERLAADLARRGSPRGDVALSRTEVEGRLLAEAGARVLLSGVGGDEVASPPDYVFDLVEQGRWVEALRECRDVSRAWESGSFPAELARALRWAAPDALAKAVRRVRRVSADRAPVWLEPDFARRCTADSPSVPARDGESMARGEVARWLRSPRLVEGLEEEERTRAWQGVELRTPFLDREVVELVLGVPFELRRKVWPAFPFKAALAAALKGDLPPLVSGRGGKAAFDDYFLRVTESWRRRLLPVLGPARGWETRGLVWPDAVDEMLQQELLAGERPWSCRGRPLWALVTGELWCRQVRRPTI